MSTSQRPERTLSVHYRVLRLLEQNPKRTQRELAEALGISVGMTNQMLKHLVDQGHLQPSYYPRTVYKLQKCAYQLTPQGIQHRQAMTRDYLERKTREFEALQAELAILRAELGESERGELTS